MEKKKKYRVGILATHPIQYYVPWYRALAKQPEIDINIFYCHKQDAKDQAKAGFDVMFDWDIPLFGGYEHRFLLNRSSRPGVYSFFGCDTPEIEDIIYGGSFDAFIVHGWSMKSYWQAIIACWRTQTPVLIRGDSTLLTKRSLIKRILKYPLYRLFIKRFDGYLVVGKRAREYYMYYGADERKMFTVPHAVDNDFFSSRRDKLEPERGQIRRSLGIPEKAVVFLFAGKLIQKKRPFDFVRAIGKAQRHVPGIFGLVVGDGKLRSGLEYVCKRDNIPVKFTGFLNQTDMTKAYTVSDALVLPSDARETWGLVVNEAMASELSAIVSDQVGCGPDLVQPGETGEIFHCGDIKRLAEIMIALASQPSRLRTMSSGARRIIDGYSIQRAVEGTVAAVRASAHLREEGAAHGS